MRSPVAKLRWIAVAVLLVLPLFCVPRTRVAAAAPQVAGAQSPGVQNPAGGFGEREPNDPEQQRIRQRMEKAQNTQRQQDLERDTDKLFDLAKQLKDEVGKSDKNTLSIDVVKKAAEIEKLAKSVKDRMRG